MRRVEHQAVASMVLVPNFIPFAFSSFSRAPRSIERARRDLAADEGGPKVAKILPSDRAMMPDTDAERHGATAGANERSKGVSERGDVRSELDDVGSERGDIGSGKTDRTWKQTGRCWERMRRRRERTQRRSTRASGATVRVKGARHTPVQLVFVKLVPPSAARRDVELITVTSISFKTTGIRYFHFQRRGGDYSELLEVYFFRNNFFSPHFVKGQGRARSVRSLLER